MESLSLGKKGGPVRHWSGLLLRLYEKHLCRVIHPIQRCTLSDIRHRRRGSFSIRSQRFGDDRVARAAGAVTETARHIACGVAPKPKGRNDIDSPLAGTGNNSLTIFRPLLAQICPRGVARRRY